MTFCSECGAQVEEGLKFCSACGKPIAASATPTQQAGMNNAQVPSASPQIPVAQPVSSAPPSQPYTPAAPPMSTPPQQQVPVVTPPPRQQPAPMYQPNVQQQTPYYQDPSTMVPAANSPYAPLSMGTYIFTMILVGLPVIGWISCLVMAFAAKNLNRRNFARAMCVFMVIALILSVIFYFAFMWFANSIVQVISEATGEALPEIGGIQGLMDLISQYWPATP